MKSNNKNTDALFDKLRNSPTELSRDNVESMIKGFPSAPLQPTEKNNWTDLFNLNNLIMTTIPIVIATMFYVFSNNTNTNDNQVSLLENTTTQNTIVIDEPIIEETISNTAAITKLDTELAKVEKDEPIEVVKKVTPKKATATNVNEVLPASPEKLIVNNQNKLSATTTTTIHSVEKAVPQNIKPITPNIQEPKQIVSADKIDQPKQEKVTPKKQKKKRTGAGTYIVSSPPNIASSRPPFLSNYQLGRLKRSLFKNLKADKLIKSKTLVLMELKGDQIFMNGKELTGIAFDKYKEITFLVGTGPNRIIKMDRKFIMVGDLSEKDGFDGVGMGTFHLETASTSMQMTQSDLFTEQDAQEKWDQEIIQERNEMNDFAISIIRKNSQTYQGIKKLLPVNIPYKKCNQLHTELYQTLIADKFVTSNLDYVLMALPKDKIIINGKQLADAQYEKYAAIIARYKIKQGAKRAIRMSEHTINIGDYQDGKFTGTISILE